MEQEESYEDEEFGVDYLVEGMKEMFNHILNTGPSEWNLNKQETKKQERRRAKLKKALRTCNYGDIGAKEYVKEYIKDLLQLKYKMNEENIDKVISFHNYNNLTSQDKFDILLYFYKKEFGANGLHVFIQTYHLDEKISETGQCYEINGKQIDAAFMTEIGRIGYGDKLEIVVQRIYQKYKGHGAIDEIRDMLIDGVSAGVSGLSNLHYHYTEEMFTSSYFDLPRAYDSIWMFYHGKTIYLSFLGFGSQRELERVCKNVYRYDNPGQLSANLGYIANDMKDGSRVIVTRPPFTESWAFFIRKFDSVEKVNTTSLLTDENSEIPIETIKWLIKGCQVIGITGEQGCGKTTLLKSLVEYINPIYTLRVQELIFELNLRKLYPNRNILSFRETPTVSGQEALDLQKKTDGTVTILGEVATAPVARWLVQLSQVASKFTMFTHHAKTTFNLVASLRNSLLQEGGFTNEVIAEEQVVETVNFDIHMVKSVDGHRYIERITEIVPYEESMFPAENISANMQEYFRFKTRKHMFYTVDIVTYKDGKYYRNHTISDRAINAISYYLNSEEKREFQSYIYGKEELIRT
ncbi:MAG: cpaF1 [Anaerocolumna sp.]|nr:cpaF1 [Anaerocolumna sp.]